MRVAYRAYSAALEVLGSMDIGFLVVERGRGARRRGSVVVGVASVLYFLWLWFLEVEVKSTGALLVKHLVPQERTVLRDVILALGFVVSIGVAVSPKKKKDGMSFEQITHNTRLTTRLPVRTKEKGRIADIWVASLVLFSVLHGDIPPVGFVRADRTHPTGPHGIPDPQPPASSPPGSFRDTQLHPLKGKPFRLSRGNPTIPPSHHTSPKMSSGESRKFTCSVCGKHYHQSSHLRRHERTRMLSTCLPSIPPSDIFHRRREKHRTDPVQVLRAVICTTVCDPLPSKHERLQMKSKKTCAIRDSNSSSCLIQRIMVGKQSPNH